jgi:hypothetical protein
MLFESDRHELPEGERWVASLLHLRTFRTPSSATATHRNQGLPRIYHRPPSGSASFAPGAPSPASCRATLGAAQQSRRLSKNPASQAALPIHRPISRQSAYPGFTPR